jgi:C-terminal processing protease CtpA/Prc
MYNKGLEALMRSDIPKYGSYLEHKFKTTSANMDLDRVYFLTTSGTASASELVITGLDPWMDVVRIGEATYGKYTGAWVIPDDYEKWAILPIVSKYSNNDGYTDFVNGLAPDYEIEDDLFETVPFGDITDPMLAKAIELATGKIYEPKSVRKREIIKYPELVPEQMMLKSSLILPGAEIYQYP